jgi:hypothetical protein
MTEGESDVDKQEILREVAGAVPFDEAPLADLPPPEPLDAPPAPEAPLEAAPPRPTPGPSWWTLHRQELAGLVTVFVSLVWISLGIATRAWLPSMIGVTFALGALLIGSQVVWAGD